MSKHEAARILELPDGPMACRLGSRRNSRLGNLRYGPGGEAASGWAWGQPETTCGFTLLELLVVVAVIGVLASLLLPTLLRSKASAYQAQCANSLRQLGLATQMYWDDNGGACFGWKVGATNGGVLYWCGWLQNGAEGERKYDPVPGVLYSYVQGRGVGVCPGLNYSMAQFKLKATGASYGYGYNLSLSRSPGEPAFRSGLLGRPAETVLFADAAQVNDFQAPASKANPMIEEWYYVNGDTTYPNGHFRHARKANAMFCDGHAGREAAVPGSLDPRLPNQFVGRLRSEILIVP